MNPSNRSRTINQRLFRIITGFTFALMVAGLMAGMFFVLVFSPQPATGTALPANIPHLVRMSLIQAGLSTALSLAIGIGLAWSLDRLRFFGRSLIISLLATAIVAPGLVVALGLIAVWGRSGWISGILSLFSLEWKTSIFGLFGIVLAYAILNGAFAAHLLLARLAAIPAQRLKLAQSLAPGPFRRFALLDWPAISSAIAPLASIIFLLSFTSFPIVLLLGGGPANQTLEVAIYSSVRLSFDLETAATLALVQLAICLVIILPSITTAPDFSPAGNTRLHHWPDRGIAGLLQIVILMVAVALFVSPLLAVLQKGLFANLSGPEFFEILQRPSFLRAAGNSVLLGITSAVLTLFIAIRIAMAAAGIGKRPLRSLLLMPVFAYLVMPSVVLSLGFFIGALNLGIDNAIAAPLVLVIANVLLALPFAYATIAPPMKSIHERYDKQARSLNLGGLARWRLVERPLLGREIGLALALAFSFSLGDLGVISLFGTSEFSTLPWEMFRAMGAYRTNYASTIATIMLLLTLFIFFALPPLFSRDKSGN